MFVGPRQLVSDDAAPCGAVDSAGVSTAKRLSIMQATAADSRVCSDFYNPLYAPKTTTCTCCDNLLHCC
jgi:hypothetical protein